MSDIKVLKHELFQLLKDKAFRRAAVTLSSGKKSDYYLDGRAVTLSARGAYLAAKLMLDLLKDEAPDAVGGPTLGADPIVGAIAALSALENKPLNTFIVRREPKKHGLSLDIEGPPLEKKMRVVLVDDVVTTGSSLVRAIDILREKEISVNKAIVLVDRKEGATQALKAKNCQLVSLFDIEEFLT